MLVRPNLLCSKGKQVLWKDGCVVWIGDLGSPIEDAEFDAITVHPDDYEFMIKFCGLKAQ